MMSLSVNQFSRPSNGCSSFGCQPAAHSVFAVLRKTLVQHFMLGYPDAGHSGLFASSSQILGTSTIDLAYSLQAQGSSSRSMQEKRMRSLVRLCVVLFPFGFASMAVAAEEQNSLIIVFKDGHQQVFSMADVARIEFKPTTSADSAPSAGRGHFLGKWKVGNGAGGYFYITLAASGEATKSIGAAHGTWTVVGSEARIKWDDGWHDAIRRVGKHYEKVAFSPEKSFTDSPSNVTDAENLEPQAN
jgi:hypothetical protein